MIEAKRTRMSRPVKRDDGGYGSRGYSGGAMIIFGEMSVGSWPSLLGKLCQIFVGQMKSTLGA
jgi:hypothetical protein